MIPVRLELKNFMSYGDEVTTLDLTGMHTICLSGENGNGKSALLDAMTWCLWGESRAGKNRHDDLVRIGADEMSVQFTFEMDGQTYRVLRKRSKRASGNQWELQQSTPESTWRSLTGNNAGETERAIQKLLRMSYDTFINAAYLRQGQADLFVKQPPGKRKEILADILDLTRYDQLETKARERAREALAESVDIERDINVIDASLSLEDQHREALTTQQLALEKLQEAQAGLKSEIDEIHKLIGQLEGQKAFADGLTTQVRQLATEMQDLEKQVQEHLAEEARWQALLGEKAKIESGYADLIAVREEFARLDVELRKFHKGQSMVAEVDSEYNILANNLRREVEIMTVEVQSAEKRLHELPRLKQEHALIQQRLSRYDDATAKRQKADAERADYATRLRKLEMESVALGQQISAWESRLQSLASQEGVCLVCNSPLPPERAVAVRAEYESERDKCIEHRKQVWADAKLAKHEAGALDETIKALDTQLAEGIDDRILFGQSEQKLKEFDAILADLPARKQKLQVQQKSLQDETFAVEIKKRRDNYQGHLQKLLQVPAQHLEVRQRLAQLEPMERQQIELGHAQASLTAAEGRRTRDVQLLDIKRASRADVEKQLASVADASATLAGHNATCAGKQSALNAVQLEERTIAQNLGRTRQLIENCERLRAERVGKDKTLTGVKKDYEVYDQLAKAFGKKGVQALIIENAIPELQDEANRLLERLTDGDMNIFFETLRESRTKQGPIETLDIKVSDSLGTRPLEMYSGGEGFRAAFALRIALSRLLARRAGARLQTLIIDEGFGTQDGKGREKLVDSLNAIKEDFEKIIVITHIDELKDAFATRVEVTKTPMGSQITIMEGATG